MPYNVLLAFAADTNCNGFSNTEFGFNILNLTL